MTHELIIGLPEAGKTTFLAALWHVVTSDEVPGSLKLLQLDGDRTYLNLIRKAWLKFEEIGRTVAQSEETVSMKLCQSDGAEPIDLVFPDMKGESFRQQWVNREWTKEYDELVREAQGILLFVHSLTSMGAERIDAALGEAVAALADEEDKAEEMKSIDEDGKLPEWNPLMAPPQVQLVELLQFIDYQRIDENVIPIAVVISAWDIVIANYDSPQQWLSERLPLLDQYLRTNGERFPLRVYGVSAQGAPLDGDLTRLQEQTRQSDRIIVVNENGSTHDITSPIKWLMQIA